MFGMGTGVALTPLPPVNLYQNIKQVAKFYQLAPKRLLSFIFEAMKIYMIKSHGRLVSLDFVIADFTSVTYQPGYLPGSFRSLRMGNLVLGWAWYLDAFSTYPEPTQLLCTALGRTTDTLAVSSTRSSRTKVNFPQISYAHTR